MTRVIVTRQPTSMPALRCDYCHGDGFCELLPMEPGSKKLACPACRYEHGRIVAALEDERTRS
jgi:hypothetical protein